MVIESWVVLNFYTGLMLVLLLFFQSDTSRIQSSRRYSALIVMTLILLCAETIGKIGETHPDNFLFLAQIGYFIIYLFDPLDILFALRYIECWMDKESLASRRIYGIAFQTFSIANILGVGISQIFGSKLFYYFEDGIYYRGPLFMFRAVFLMIFIILLLVYVLVYQKNIISDYKKAIILLPALSFLGSVLQIFIANMDMTYAGISIGCLILFFYLQSRDVNVDYLTGIMNRRGLDMMLDDKIKQALTSGTRFSAIMMDVDHFKEINDHYGHKAGDKTVQDVAEILVNIFGQDAGIGRFGGDEFCVISNIVSDETICEKLSRVHEEINKLKKLRGWNEALDVSCGYKIYDPAQHETVEAFQESIDILMYEEKKQHHLNDRRKVEI